IFELTGAGRAEATERQSTQGNPWDEMAGRGGHGGLHKAVRDLHLAARQVGMTGSTDVVERATEILTEARKELYRLLMES
ncbi:MAG TPA: PadR family transcriptional regulator, partial [Acidimicrobiia bacterium]|nr:PadR family transcriptional regulator [Acidimicrobiia bacterium]